MHSLQSWIRIKAFKDEHLWTKLKQNGAISSPLPRASAFHFDFLQILLLISSVQLCPEPKTEVSYLHSFLATVTKQRIRSTNASSIPPTREGVSKFGVWTWKKCGNAMRHVNSHWTFVRLGLNCNNLVVRRRGMQISSLGKMFRKSCTT